MSVVKYRESHYVRVLDMYESTKNSMCSMAIGACALLFFLLARANWLEDK